MRDALTVIETVHAPRDRVWRALTDPDDVAAWWGEGVAVEPGRNGLYRERWSRLGRSTLTIGRVVGWDPPQRLEFAWRDDDWPGETAVLIELQPLSPRATQIRLTHSDWSGAPAHRRATLINAHERGWRGLIARLDEWLAAAEWERPR